MTPSPAGERAPGRPVSLPQSASEAQRDPKLVCWATRIPSPGAKKTPCYSYPRRFCWRINMADHDDPDHGGGIHDDLREQHAKELTSEHDLFGWAIGGLSVGKDKADMMRALASTTTHMPEHKPRYLMGVGTPEDLLDGISLDVDMFDCVMLTRNAKINGVYLVPRRRNLF